MQILPACATSTLGTVSMDTLANPVNPAQLFYIQMNHVAGGFVLVQPATLLGRSDPLAACLLGPYRNSKKAISGKSTGDGP